MAVLVPCVVGHAHVSLSDGLTGDSDTDTAEVDRFFQGQRDDREPIYKQRGGGHWAFRVSTFPNSTSSRAREGTGLHGLCNVLTNKLSISPELEMSQKIVGILGGRELEIYKVLDSS